MYLNLEKALHYAYKRHIQVHGTRHDGNAKELTVSIDTSDASGLSGMSGHTGMVRSGSG